LEFVDILRAVNEDLFEILGVQCATDLARFGLCCRQTKDALMASLAASHVESLESLAAQNTISQLGSNVVCFETTNVSDISQSWSRVHEFAQVLLRHRSIVVDMEVHYPAWEPAPVALRCSEKWGLTVASVLKRCGVQGSRVHVHGWGSSLIDCQATRCFSQDAPSVEFFFICDGVEFPPRPDCYSDANIARGGETRSRWKSTLCKLPMKCTDHVGSESSTASCCISPWASTDGVGSKCSITSSGSSRSFRSSVSCTSALCSPGQRFVTALGGPFHQEVVTSPGIHEGRPRSGSSWATWTMASIPRLKR